MAKMNKNILLVDTNSIIPNPNQPRKKFDEEAINELAESIRNCGIIQPLTVKSIPNGNFELISGERRLRAAMSIGMKKVPCVVLLAENMDSSLMSIIENIQREDLNFLEEALAYKQLMERYGMTQEMVARKVGKRQSTIANKVRLLKHDEGLLSRILENSLTERHARALLKLPDTKAREEAVDVIIKRELNVQQTDDLVERMREGLVINSKKTNVRNVFNYKIYANTVRRAYKDILKTGLDAEYKEVEHEDRVDLVISIPKK